MDDDIRSRFRRDFTSEPIGRPRQSYPQTAPQPQPAPAPRPAIERPQPIPHAKPAAPQPSAVSFEPPQRPYHKKKSRKKLLVVISLVIIVLAGGAATYRFKFRPANPIPANIRSSVSYPILYPSKLPPGYKIVASSFSSSSGAVIFEADDQSSDKIAFSVQKRPATFDFTKFYKEGLGNAATFSTDIGEAAVGTVSGKPIGSFVTDKSWVLVSSSSQNVTSSNIRLILNNIKQAD